MTSTRAPIVEVSLLEPAEAVVQQAVSVLAAGGVIAFPTDTLYGLGCGFGQTQAIERIQTMRGLDLATRPLTFLLPDLGELPRFTRMSESGYRMVNRIPTQGEARRPPRLEAAIAFCEGADYDINGPGPRRLFDLAPNPLFGAPQRLDALEPPRPATRHDLGGLPGLHRRDASAARLEGDHPFLSADGVHLPGHHRGGHVARHDRAGNRMSDFQDGIVAGSLQGAPDALSGGQEKSGRHATGHEQRGQHP